MDPRAMVSVAGLSEPLSSLSHWGAAAFICFATVPLLGRWGTRRQVIAVTCWALATSFMFCCSGTYHSLDLNHPLRNVFWHLDHAMIWIALAFLFTAMQALTDPEPRLPVLGLLWALALTGVVLELSWLSELPPWVSPLLYVGMGWAGFPTLLRLIRRHGFANAGWLLFGGISCTIGGFIDSFNAPTLYPGVFEAHELMHLFVGGGAVLAWKGIVTCFKRHPRELAPRELASESAAAAT